MVTAEYLIKIGSDNSVQDSLTVCSVHHHKSQYLQIILKKNEMHKKNNTSYEYLYQIIITVYKKKLHAHILNNYHPCFVSITTEQRKLFYKYGSNENLLVLGSYWKLMNLSNYNNNLLYVRIVYCNTQTKFIHHISKP